MLCLESEVPYRFHEEDKASIELLGSYLAIAIQHMQWQERSTDAVGEAATHTATPIAVPPADSRVANGTRREIAYYAADECISSTATI